MGQQYSAHENDSSCFRACLRDKKSKSLKSPAGPLHSPKQPISPLFPNPDNNKISQQSKKLPYLPKPKPTQLKDSETSLDFRYQTDTKPNTQVRHKVSAEEKQTVVKQKPSDVDGNQEEVGALGLQSKFSSSFKSRTKVFGKGHRASEGGTRYASQKEVGSSQQTSSKSQQSESTNTRSRKILLNKIEDIKQKYYERELQIEIYQDEHQYQQQLNELAKLEQKCQEEHGELPLASVREITSIKKNILEKLSNRKLLRNNSKKQNKTNSAQHQDHDEPANNAELELYSRQNIRQLQTEDELKSSRRTTARKEKLNKSSRSIDSSQDVSLEERVEFSQYSQQDTLQEIRQCDEEEEDYKSKVDSKVKQAFKGLGLPSQRMPSRNSNLNCKKQASGSISEKNSQSVKQIKLREVEVVSKCSSSKQVRAAASPRLSRGGEQRSDNKILFF